MTAPFFFTNKSAAARFQRRHQLGIDRLQAGRYRCAGTHPDRTTAAQTIYAAMPRRGSTAASKFAVLDTSIARIS